MDNDKILVTGGAGYIGSHVVRQLGANGENVITLDNLSTGFEAAVTSGELIIGDTGDAALLDRIFENHDIDTVMHFAAHTIVPESVSDPLKYYGNNIARYSSARMPMASNMSFFRRRQPSTVFRPRAQHQRQPRHDRLTLMAAQSS